MTDDIIGDLFCAVNGDAWSIVIGTRARSSLRVIWSSHRRLILHHLFTSLAAAAAVSSPSPIHDFYFYFSCRLESTNSWSIERERRRLAPQSGMHAITSRSKLKSSHESASAHAKCRLFLTNWFSLRPSLVGVTGLLAGWLAALDHGGACMHNLCDKLISLYKFQQDAKYTESLEARLRHAFTLY